MIREWAREFYGEPLRAHGCQVCGLHYVRTLPEDRAQHRRHHQQVIRVFSPSPSAMLKKAFDEHGKFVPVRANSKRWLRHRLYEIALMFKREKDYDFVQWDETGDDGHGYLLVDGEGRALGGAVVRWREYKEFTGWFLAWVWIAPPHRRQGLLKTLWEMCRRQYPGILPEPPFSYEAAMFIQGIEDLPEKVRQYAREIALNDTRDNAS